MPLLDLSLSKDVVSLPTDVRAFLGEADRRIERFQSERAIPGFVPSDYVSVYAVLQALAAEGVAPGKLFCEWGSGFGVVACLAAMLDFDACGIEIEGELVDAAQELADDFDLPVQFIRGSFIPEGSEPCLDPSADYAWLTTHGESPEEELGLAPADFSVIFAYPWPDEENLVGALFERHAHTGAVLVTYHASHDLRLRRKTGVRKKR